MPSMARREDFSLDTIIIASIASVALLAACWQGPTTGPGTVQWDRQTCDRCQMVISERRHAVQIRIPGQNETHAFDDLGCALLWLDDQGLEETEPDESSPRREVWVRDETGANWIDGYDARFEDGLPTPMAYGFGVAEDGISLGVVQERVRDAERQRRTDRARAMSAEDKSGG